MECFNDTRNWSGTRLNFRGKMMWCVELILNAVIALLIIGCILVFGTLIANGTKVTEMKAYQVTVYTSTGALHNEFKIQSVSRPVLQWRGNNLYLTDKGTSEVHEWERNPVAPGGWLVTVEPITEEERRHE